MLKCSAIYVLQISRNYEYNTYRYIRLHILSHGYPSIRDGYGYAVKNREVCSLLRLPNRLSLGFHFSLVTLNLLSRSILSMSKASFGFVVLNSKVTISLRFLFFCTT